MLDVLKTHGIHRVMLLVIPGLPWREEQVEVLRQWVAEGHVLAGHGRIHQVKEIRTVYHKLHSVLISRDVAEHLSLSEDGIADLMLENARWFETQDLPVPTHYVPPAWALGPISRNRLRDLPFQTVEVLRGVIDVRSGRLHRMPLLGYEADTAFRALFLRGSNAWNRLAACWNPRGIRISLHPEDLNLRRSACLLNDCARFEVQADLPDFT
jgi:predicted deacetylase